MLTVKVAYSILMQKIINIHTYPLCYVCWRLDFPQATQLCPLFFPLTRFRALHFNLSLARADLQDYPVKIAIRSGAGNPLNLLSNSPGHFAFSIRGSVPSIR